MEETSIIVRDPGQALRKVHKQTKITRKAKLLALELLAKDFNITKTATALKVARSTLIRAIENDEQFRDAVQEIKEGYLDTIEGVGFKVALQPDRTGFNDRKLMLQAHRPEIYNPVQKTEVNFTIREENATIEARKILQNLAVENVDYKVIQDEKLNK